MNMNANIRIEKVYCEINRKKVTKIYVNETLVARVKRIDDRFEARFSEGRIGQFRLTNYDGYYGLSDGCYDTLKFIKSRIERYVKNN